MKPPVLEIYNFLNLVCRRLGRVYKYTGQNSLPKDFVISKAQIKHVLLLAQLRQPLVLPDFVCEDKKYFKQYIKNSLKNCKKIAKENSFKDFCSEKFARQLDIYFDMRRDLTELVLKDFKKYDFDEGDAYQEIFNLDPILGELLDDLFEEKVDNKKLFEGLEEKYNQIYQKRIAALEKKKTKRRKQKEVVRELDNFAAQKSKKLQEKSKKTAKKEEKTAKITKKTEKRQEIKNLKNDLKQQSKGGKEKI